jgi:hypothetical protein
MNTTETNPTISASRQASAAHGTLLRIKRLGIICFALVQSLVIGTARDWYVCAETGTGKAGAKEQPAKDLGNICAGFQAGDRVFIAEGNYTGRGANGSDLIIVPVEIYGGWDKDFSQRDPWGAHQTILSGENKSANWSGEARLAVDLSKYRSAGSHKVVVDGVIVDNGARNRYGDSSMANLVRPANPQAGENPTPRTAGICVRMGKQGSGAVRNCIVMNTAPNEGAYSLWGNQDGELIVENNLAINNTGSGFALHTQWHPRDGKGVPKFTFRNNTSLFSEKPDALASDGGNGLKLENDTRVEITGCVLAFNDRFGIDNARQANGVVLNGNLVGNNLQGDYLEFNSRMSLDSLTDTAKHVAQAQGNVVNLITVPVGKEWAVFYGARSVLDRNAAEAEVKAQKTRLNALRSMLGLNVQGSNLKADTEAWLPRMTVADAIRAGQNPYDQKYGCKQPASSGGIE